MPPSNSPIQHFLVAPNDAGQRLDRFLKKLLPNAALTLIYKLNRSKRVSVNGVRQDNEYRLVAGETVSLRMYTDEIERLREVRPIAATSHWAQLFDAKSVLFEDAHMIVVNKQPGMNVHPGDHKTDEVSLIQQVQDYLWKEVRSLTFAPALVHRLDRDTSGAVMIAKTKSALTVLLDALQSHEIEKTYVALVVGTLPETRWVIRAKLLRTDDSNQTSKGKVIVSEEGQTAVTHYRVIEGGIQDKYSLVACRLETGRMHQIRVHLASLGCPIVGDRLYGSRSENAHAQQQFSVQRQLLHAYQLVLQHPEQKQRTLTLRARIPSDIAQFVRPESLEKVFPTLKKEPHKKES